MNETIAHNTQLTQQNWEMISAMQYDVSNIFIHLGLDYHPQQYHQPAQEDPI